VVWERVAIALISAAAAAGGAWLGYELKGGGPATAFWLVGVLGAIICGVLGWHGTAKGQRRRPSR
jgi:peptidoglycan/LPS O-acetylase OafA/YrhL